MRIWIATVALALAACTGDAPTGDRTCAGNLYDSCSDEHNCTSGNCHNFNTQSFQVCSVNCTVGDDTPCMTTDDGRKATCVAVTGTVGICTPPAANACKAAP
jgi:hypothetical protein